jgi:hypothetical protein
LLEKPHTAMKDLAESAPLSPIVLPDSIEKAVSAAKGIPPATIISNVLPVEPTPIVREI